jgi:hypothetical protein
VFVVSVNSGLRGWKAQRVIQKTVDANDEALHNLVSLLLMQQRSKRRVVQGFSGVRQVVRKGSLKPEPRVKPGSLRDVIFNNLQPISVGA